MPCGVHNTDKSFINSKFTTSLAYASKEVVFMRNRHDNCNQCDINAREKFYPVCRIGQILIFVGLGLAFLSFIFGFWLALLGAALVLIGFLVIQCC